jgi:hypothetical protein
VTTIRIRLDRRPSTKGPLVGLWIAVVLMVAAMVIPLVLGWDVHAEDFAPLDSIWRPRFGPGTLPAVAVALLASTYARQLSESLRWRPLLLATVAAGLAWLISLATVDGWAGIGSVLGRGNEYLGDARATTDVSSALHDFVARIPAGSPDNWHTHVAGHPPGALLFFVLLVRLGLGSGLAAGFVVLVIASSTPAAVMLTLERLGAEDLARRAAPFLVFGPAAIWSAVSADAMFTACGAWGLCCLTVAATTSGRRRATCWALGAGLVLGYCVLLSYGLPLLGILAVAVLVAARDVRPLLWATVSAAAVVLVFAGLGVSWWAAYPVLRVRYYAGIASLRPAAYWAWGDLAALAFSAGPLLGAALGATAVRGTSLVRGRRDRTGTGWTGSPRVAVLLVGAASLCIVLADLSFMSKAETERIWLPFVPWLLLGCALLPTSWQRRGLAAQVAFALVVQTLLYTRW